jgi:hypothetical protein
VGGTEGAEGPEEGMEEVGEAVVGTALGVDEVGTDVDGLEEMGEADGTDVEGDDVDGLVVGGEPVGRVVGTCDGQSEYRKRLRTQPPWEKAVSTLFAEFTDNLDVMTLDVKSTQLIEESLPIGLNSTSTLSEANAPVRSTMDS